MLNGSFTKASAFFALYANALWKRAVGNVRALLLEVFWPRVWLYSIYISVDIDT